VYDVIFENGGAEIFVSVNTRLCVNVALDEYELRCGSLQEAAAGDSFSDVSATFQKGIYW